MPAAQPQFAPKAVSDELESTAAAPPKVNPATGYTTGADRLIDRQAAWIEALSIALDCDSSDAANAHVVSLLHSAIRSSRVALALCTETGLQLAASSQQTDVKKSGSQATIALQAMQEAIDQDTTIVYPLISDSLTITDAHKQLVGGRADTHVMSVPLVHRETVVGVALFEIRKQEPWDAATRAFAEQLCAGVAPVLALHRKASRGLNQHVKDSFKSSLVSAFGAKNLTLKCIGIVCAAGVFLSAVLPMHRSVIADAEISPSEKHLVSSPGSGFIETVHVRSGEVVVQDQLLLTLDTRELNLQTTRRQLEVDRLNGEVRGAMADHDRKAMAVAQAKLDRARAELALAELELTRAEVRAPHDGYVLGQALSKAQGAPVTRGDALLQIAPAGDYEVHLLVDESEVAAVGPGSTGELALKSAPGRALPFEVDSVRPIAESADGQTRFRAIARVETQGSPLRPGQTGLAHIQAEKHSVLRVLTWRISRWASEQWWAWFG